MVYHQSLSLNVRDYTLINNKLVYNYDYHSKVASSVILPSQKPTGFILKYEVLNLLKMFL